MGKYPIALWTRLRTALQKILAKAERILTDFQENVPDW